MKNYYNDPAKEETYRKEITKRVLPQKEKRRKWKGKTTNMYWLGDLIDFSTISNYNHKQKYILVIMDLYSRYVFAQHLKSKSTIDLKAAFDKIFDQSRNPITNEIEYPNFLCFDDESAINTQEMKQYLQSKNIELYHAYGKYKVSPIERFIRTFKEDLSYYFTNHRYNWYDYYQDIVNVYNKKKHSTLYKKKEHLTPEIVQSRQDDYTEKEFPPHLSKKDKTAQFQIGDHVRLKINKNNFKLKKKSLQQNYSSDIYKIVSIDKSNLPYTYKVKCIDRKIKSVKDLADWRRNSEDNPEKYRDVLHELNNAEKRAWYHHELIRSKL